MYLRQRLITLKTPRCSPKISATRRIFNSLSFEIDLLLQLANLT